MALSRWRRLRRRTLAPNRPVLFPEQYGLALVTFLVVAGSIGVVLYALTR
jgi:hypothetical protein